MNCPICKNKNAKLIYSQYPGYIEESKYDIYHCGRCDTNFVSPNKIDKKIYDLIYSDKMTPGTYGSFFKLAQQIKSQKNPLRFLLNSAHTYYPIVNYLNNINSQNLDILEVGCGYGYLTYSLNFEGHNAIGIDVSEVAIKFALENFGANYLKADIDQFRDTNRKSNKKFDLIVTIDVIEHLSNPTSFIKQCFALLKDSGRLILTTPNKSYFKKNYVWCTDLPPVHLFCMSPTTFQYIARSNNFNISFSNFANYTSFKEKENKLVHYFLSRVKKESISLPIFKESGKPNPERFVKFSIKKRFLKYLINIKFIKYLSNVYYSIFFRSKNHYFTIGVTLWKK